MGVKLKQLTGIGCIVGCLFAVVANANVQKNMSDYFGGGEWYLGGSFGKGFTGKKIKDKHFPALTEIGAVNINDTQELSYKKGNAISIFFGTKIENLRYQLELSSIKTKYKEMWNNGIGGRTNLYSLSSEYTKTLSIIPQIYYDFSASKAVDLIPYIGAGLGYSKISNYWIYCDFHSETTQKQDKVAGQLIAGVRYKFTKNLAVSLDYKYFRVFGKLKALDSNYYNNSIQAGLVVNI